MTTDGRSSDRDSRPTSEAGALPLWKRALDLSAILVLSPGFLLAAIAVALVIKLGSSGPLFFTQPRVGYKGRRFTCYKFRTMRNGAETESHKNYTQQLIHSKNAMVKLDNCKDPRLIPLGGLLRACGMDELPQLYNIIRGDMSLVGPRPCIPYECEAYAPWHWQRFDAAPGLTGLWQVSGKNRTTFEQMVKLDIQYARTRSLWLDLKIIFKTPQALWTQFCELLENRRRRSESASQCEQREIKGRVRSPQRIASDVPTLTRSIPSFRL